MNLEQQLANSSNILIRLPQSPQKEDIQDLFILFCALTKLGKQITIEGPVSGIDLFAEHAQPQQENTFVLTLKSIAPLVSRVYYDKTSQDLKFTITLSEGTLQQDRIQLNALHGEKFIVSIGKTEAQDSDNLAYASQLIPFLLHRFSQQEQAQLLLGSTIAAAMKKLPGTPLFISLVSPQFFQDTQTTPKTLTGVVNLFRECFPQKHSYLILYKVDSSETAHGLLHSSVPEIQKRILQAFSGEGKEQWTLFTLPESDLSQTKEKIIHTLSPLWQTP